MRFLSQQLDRGERLELTRASLHEVCSVDNVKFLAGVGSIRIVALGASAGNIGKKSKIR
jgi:hypothetical protein